MAISEFQDNTEKKPLESYSFKFSEEEYNEAMRAYFKGHIVRIVIFSVLIAAFIFYIIFRGDNSFICGLAVGLEAVGLWFLVVALVRSRKSWKKSKAKICASDYNYEFFEDYLLLDIIRGGERAGFHRFDYADLQQKIDTGKYYLLVFANQIYMVKKQEISQTSVFHSLKPKSPEKPKKIIKVLSSVLMVLTILTLFCAMISAAMVNINSVGIVKYWWYVFLFLPIPVISYGFGVFWKRKYNLGRGNVFTGLIAIVVILCMFLLLNQTEPTKNYPDKYQNILSVGSYIDFDLPYPNEYEELSVDAEGVLHKNIFMKFGYFETNEFEELINDSGIWRAVVSDEMAEITDVIDIPYGWEYCCVYNIANDEYNTVPAENGTYYMAAMFYDMDADELRVIEYEYIK